MRLSAVFGGWGTTVNKASDLDDARMGDMKHDIPGVGTIEIETIILDLNGTLSVAGVIPGGTMLRLTRLKELGYRLVMFTGNTRGDADQLAARLGIEWKLAKSAEDKLRLTQELGPERCASIGNGRIDKEMMEAVALAVLTMQAEGVHVETLLVSDIVVPSVVDALDLFIDPARLIATLRK